MKDKRTTIALISMQAIMLLAIGGLFFQNQALAKSVELYSTENSTIHEIWDNSQVVAAYKDGKEENLTEEDKYVLGQVKKVIKENIKDGMTEYEKEKAIYDWQVKYIAFNEDSLAPINNGDKYSHMPYGVLKYHNAICVGNMTTFKLFMDVMGIENDYIHSTESGEHAWNLVKLDGDWYHVDITFDGGGKNPKYTYFNVPDSVKDDGSYPWNREDKPAADGTKYCYIANNAKDLEDIYHIPKALKSALADGKQSLYYTLKDKKDANYEVIEFICSSLNTFNTSLNAGTAYVVGEKTIYSINNDMTEEKPNEDNDKIFEKLNSIIDKLV